MGMSEARKLAKLEARERDKQRMFSLLTNPLLLALGGFLAGTYIANSVKWSDDATRNADIRAIAMAGTAIGAMSYLGVHDKWVLGAFGTAAGLAGLDPVSLPGLSSLTENYGLGADARLFGTPVPGITPGYPAWE